MPSGQIDEFCEFSGDSAQKHHARSQSLSIVDPCQYASRSPAAALFPFDAPYATLALGHALLARVRIAPVIGDGANELDPFVVAVRRIEQANGCMSQAQIRLLKDAPTPLGIEERERLIEAKQEAVDTAFEQVLRWLAQGDGVSTSRN
jgi:hypothetical protein